MKRSSKLVCLFSLWLLSGLFTMIAANVTNGIKIDLDKFNDITTHRTNQKARLKLLYLWDWSDNESAGWMATSSDAATLDVFKGLIVNSSFSDLEYGWALIVVWWWQKNIINWSNQSGIAWWYDNKIKKETTSASDINNAAIGGGDGNSVSGENGVVAWWKKNTWNEGWVVLWWFDNISDGVVLWWRGNTAGTNGLAMWQWAKWRDWSFVWNDNAAEPVEAVANSARIWAQKWVLIGTYTPKEGVSLVVEWPIKIWNNSSDMSTGTPWEIRSLNNGCLYAHDGSKWHILGNSDQTACSAGITDYLAKTCDFGVISLQEWDEVYAYSMRYSPDWACGDPVKIKCTNGNLVPVNGWNAGTYYPACYNLSEDPWYYPSNN